MMADLTVRQELKAAFGSAPQIFGAVSERIAAAPSTQLLLGAAIIMCGWLLLSGSILTQKRQKSYLGREVHSYLRW